MFKRIITTALAAAMLATAAPVAIVADNGDGGGAPIASPAPFAAAANAPYSAVDGEIAVPLGTNGNELLACFADRTGATVSAADGSEMAFTTDLASGATVSRGDDSVTAIVPGDVNGDAKINARDVIAAMKVSLGESEGVFASAADVEKDGSTNARDVVKLMKYIVGWNETLGFEREAAASDDDALTMYFASTMQRIAREDNHILGTPDGTIRMAKNEIEDAHMILISREQKTGLTLDVGAITNADGAVLDREVRYGHYYDSVIWRNLDYIPNDYSNYIEGYWADPYPELRGAFDIGAKENQSFIVKVKTTEETAAGWYSAPIRVLDSAGNELKKATLWVYVWDFAIDNTRLSRTTLDTYSQGVAGWFVGQADKKYADGAVWQPWYKKWYDYILENKMNTAELPYDVLSEEANEYLDDPRVTSFISQTGKDANCWDDAGTAPRLRAIYDKLSQKEEWLEKAYIYTVDEPWDQRGAAWIMKQWNSAKEALGDIPFQTIVPYYNNWQSGLEMDLTEQLWDYCNCFCPDAICFNITADRRTRKKDLQTYPAWGNYMDDKQFEKYGQFAPRYEAMRERGDKMWWYICVTPVYPAPNFFNTYQGAWVRIVLWQQYNVHADGFLYWSLVAWDMGEHDHRKINLKRTNGGDGMLIYPGNLWYGDDEPLPVPSIRFENVRDGFEDYAYMRMLEDHIGREATLEYCDRITPDTLHFTQDWRDIDAVRDEMGFELEALSASAQ